MKAADQAVLNRMADNGCALDDLDTVSRALERARVVGVLDGWAEARFGTEGFHATMRREVSPDDQTRFQWQTRVAYIENGRTHIAIETYGDSADEARSKAAAAIERGEV